MFFLHVFLSHLERSGGISYEHGVGSSSDKSFDMIGDIRDAKNYTKKSTKKEDDETDERGVFFEFFSFFFAGKLVLILEITGAGIERFLLKIAKIG